MADTTLKKANQGYNYKYTDLAQINGWCQDNGITYSQVVKLIDGQQFIETTYYKDGKEHGPFLGAQVIKAAPGGKVNEAQIYGSGLTYARRYSLLMCLGLATDDDDAECYSPRSQQTAPAPARQPTFADELKAMKEQDDKAYEAVRKIITDNGWRCMGDIPADRQPEIRKAYADARTQQQQQG